MRHQAGRSPGDGVRLIDRSVRAQLRDVRIRDRLVFLNLVDVDVVESGEVMEVRVVDHAQREELADAWFGDAVFELGQPTVRDAKALVAFDFGDSDARLLDLSNSDVAPVAKGLQCSTGRHGINLERTTVRVPPRNSFDSG